MYRFEGTKEVFGEIPRIYREFPDRCEPGEAEYLPFIEPCKESAGVEICGEVGIHSGLELRAESASNGYAEHTVASTPARSSIEPRTPQKIKRLPDSKP